MARPPRNNVDYFPHECIHGRKMFVIENEKKIYESQIKAVESIFSIYNDGYCFSEKFKLSVRGFIEKLGLQEVIHSMEISCNKPLNKRDYVLRYFCGVCWSKIKGI